MGAQQDKRRWRQQAVWLSGFGQITRVNVAANQIQ